MAKAAGKDVDQRDTRARILAAARATFAEHGYSGASVSKIARRAGVLAGSLYWAFPSKEALFAAVLTEASEAWRARYIKAPDPSPAIDEIRVDIRKIASGFAEAPEFLRLLMVVATEHQAGAPEIRAAAIEIRRSWRASIESGLVAGLAGHPPDTVAALARRISRLVIQLLDGVFMSLQFEQAELGPDALIAEVADVVQRELDFGVRALEAGA